MRGAEIESWRGRRRNVRELAFCDQSLLEQFLGTDQQSVAGESRVTRIRRISVACWSQRQNLPKTLAAGYEEIRERKSGRPEVADGKTSRQRGRMKQNAAGPGEAHLLGFIWTGETCEHSSPAT